MVRDRGDYFKKRSVIKRKIGECHWCSRPRLEGMSHCFKHWLRTIRPEWLGGGYKHSNPFYLHEIPTKRQELNFNMQTKHLYLPNIWKVWECFNLLMLDDRLTYSDALSIQTKLEYEDNDELSLELSKLLVPYADQVFTYQDFDGDRDHEWLQKQIDYEDLGAAGFMVISRGYYKDDNYEEWKIGDFMRIDD